MLNVKSYRLLSVLFICLFIGIMPVAAATITSEKVSAHGWNSCSKGWYHTSGTFVNKCPFDGGKLLWNPKGDPSGEWTCRSCGADFCICGRCKAGGSGVYLKHYVKPSVPIVVNNTIIQPPIPSKLEIIKQKLNEPIILGGL